MLTARCIACEEFVDAVQCIILSYRFQIVAKNLPRGLRCHNAILNFTVDKIYTSLTKFQVGHSYDIKEVLDAIAINIEIPT